MCRTNAQDETSRITLVTRQVYKFDSEIHSVISYDASLIRSKCYVNVVTSLMLLVTYSYIVFIRQIHLSYYCMSLN